MRLAKSTAFIFLGLSGCLSGPAFMKQKGNANLQSTLGEAKVTKDAAVVGDADGVLTASLDPNTDAAQLVSASSSSAIAGSSITFPPGSIAIATDITVEEGATLASDSVASDLGAGAGSLSAASPAMVISSSASTDATQPFTISLVLGSSLYLDNAGKDLIVVYKVKKASDGGTYIGVIPKEDVSLAEGKASFKASYFGSYQAVYTTGTLVRVEKSTTAPIVTRREETSAQTLSAATDVNDLKVNNKGENFVELGWQPATVAAGYVVRIQTGNTVAMGCREGDFKPLPGQNTLAGRFDGLAANTLYSFRVCSVAPGVSDSPGKTISVSTSSSSTTPETIPVVASVLAMPASSKWVQLTWSAPAGLPAGAVYHIVWKQGSTSAAGPTTPTSCADAAAEAREVSAPGAEIGPFYAEREIRGLVCVKVGSNFGPGRAFSVRSGMLAAIPCQSGGSLDTICELNATVMGGIYNLPSASHKISGMGKLVVIGTVMPATGLRLEIDMEDGIQLGDAAVPSYGYINADGRGEAAASSTGQGPNPGSGTCLPDCTNSAYLTTGGGHGGEGGFPDGRWAEAGDSHGDYEFPNDFGSSGAKVSGIANPNGSYGGGVIYLRTPATLSIHGGVSADGIGGPGARDAGGAGGSIQIFADQITANSPGSGALRAIGGAGNTGGGGGAGGRISIHAGQAVSANVTAEAIGGISGGEAMRGGAAGTYFVATSVERKLTIKNMSGLQTVNSRTPFNPNQRPLNQLTVTDKAKLWLTQEHNPAQAQIGYVNLEVLGGIDHSGRGFPGGAGSGTPTSGQGNGAGQAQGGGGGNAGAGGNGQQAGTGGAGAVGNANAPTIFGSGGAGGPATGAHGGEGGGAIRLTVAHTLTISGGGYIAAKGLPGVNSSSICGGGGAGGSIWVTAASIVAQSVPTSFLAGGGAGDSGSCSSNGGGGGGGYVTVSPAVSTTACEAPGGTSSNAGAAGIMTGCTLP